MNSSFLLSAPYPEGAIVSLGRHLSKHSLLGAMVSPSRRVARVASNAVLALGNRSLSFRLRRAPVDLAELVEISPLMELVRLGVAASGRRRAMNRWMYESKRHFDACVARRCLTDHAVVIGMPGACKLTFSRSSAAVKVFHSVDAHPRIHNEVLISHYGKRRAIDELLPEWMVARIEAELSLCDVVLTPSTLVSGQMLSNGVSKDKLVQVPYGVSLSAFTSELTRSERSSSRPQILYVGQISLRKGIPFLIEAVRNVPIDLQLIGPLVDSRLIERLPSNVHYSGARSTTEVAVAMANADAFVLPSVEDACALVVAEAAAAGLPVITTTMNGSAEILGPLDLSCLAPGDVGALRQCLANVQILTVEQRNERADRLRCRASRDIHFEGIYGWSEYSETVVRRIAPFINGRPTLGAKK